MLPRIELGAMRALYVGDPPDIEAHATLAANFVFALEGTLRIETSAGTLGGVRAAFVPPGVRRRDVFAPGDRVASLWLEPLDELVDRSEELEVRVGRLRGGDLPDLRALIAGGAALAEIPGRLRLPKDRRVASIVRAFREGRDLDRDLTDFATSLAVSPSHLMRAFRAEVGLTFRQYRTLLRLYTALRGFTEGTASWTTLALDTGFASPAHFSDTFRKVFGMSAGATAVSKRRRERPKAPTRGQRGQR